MIAIIKQGKFFYSDTKINDAISDIKTSLIFMGK